MCHISEIIAVDDVTVEDEENEDEESMESLEDKTERTLNILQCPQAKYPAFSHVNNPVSPLGNVFEHKRLTMIGREGLRPKYKLRNPPPTSWSLDVDNISDVLGLNESSEEEPLFQILGKC